MGTVYCIYGNIATFGFSGRLRSRQLPAGSTNNPNGLRSKPNFYSRCRQKALFALHSTLENAFQVINFDTPGRFWICSQPALQIGTFSRRIAKCVLPPATMLKTRSGSIVVTSTSLYMCGAITRSAKILPRKLAAHSPMRRYARF